MRYGYLLSGPKSFNGVVGTGWESFIYTHLLIYNILDGVFISEKQSTYHFTVSIILIQNNIMNMSSGLTEYIKSRHAEDKPTHQIPNRRPFVPTKQPFQITRPDSSQLT